MRWIAGQICRARSQRSLVEGMGGNAVQIGSEAEQVGYAAIIAAGVDCQPCPGPPAANGGVADPFVSSQCNPAPKPQRAAAAPAVRRLAMQSVTANQFCDRIRTYMLSGAKRDGVPKERCTMDWRFYHAQSEHNASAAELAQKRHDHAQAVRRFERAAEHETMALESA